MEERRQILESIEAGEISVEEAVRRLEALEAPPAAQPETLEPPTPRPDALPVRPRLVHLIWQAVLWTGVVLVVGGGLLVASVYSWQEVGSGWLICGWPLLGMGALVVALGWWMRTARWFSLRVKEPSGPKFTLALPLPLGPIAWLLRVLRPFIPKLEETGVDEILTAMHEGMQDGDPFIVEVNEGENGEQVQVYFG
jgi:hypothetical protein